VILRGQPCGREREMRDVLRQQQRLVVSRGRMAARIQNAVGSLSGVSAVTIHAEDASIRFTVKSKLDIVDLQTAVQSVDKGAIVASPTFLQ